VADECRLADSLKKLSPGSTRALLALLSPDVNDGQHPHELSEGQRLGLALALTLASEPEILLLDEPTRGLDSHGKRELHKVIAELKVRNCTIVVATHDVELAAEVADRIVVLADGAIVTEGNSHEVLTASTMFAPVTAKVLSPLQWISVGEVERALG
jgi:energy-coupling factor transport system ATP-binding protein